MLIFFAKIVYNKKTLINLIQSEQIILQLTLRNKLTNNFAIYKVFPANIFSLNMSFANNFLFLKTFGILKKLDIFGVIFSLSDILLCFLQLN